MGIGRCQAAVQSGEHDTIFSGQDVFLQIGAVTRKQEKVSEISSSVTDEIVGSKPVKV
jgi:hypothetical protein